MSQILDIPGGLQMRGGKINETRGNRNIPVRGTIQISNEFNLE